MPSPWPPDPAAARPTLRCRRFVARTTAQLTAWQSAPLDSLDLVALLIDGVGRALFPNAHDTLAFAVLVLAIAASCTWLAGCNTAPKAASPPG